VEGHVFVMSVLILRVTTTISG